MNEPKLTWRKLADTEVIKSGDMLASYDPNMPLEDLHEYTEKTILAPAVRVVGRRAGPALAFVVQTNPGLYIGCFRPVAVAAGDSPTGKAVWRKLEIGEIIAHGDMLVDSDGPQYDMNCSLEEALNWRAGPARRRPGPIMELAARMVGKPVMAESTWMAWRMTVVADSPVNTDEVSNERKIEPDL